MEIPEAVWAEAKALADEVLKVSLQSDKPHRGAEIIASAILAERVRCRNSLRIWLSEGGYKDFANSILGVVE